MFSIQKIHCDGFQSPAIPLKHAKQSLQGTFKFIYLFMHKYIYVFHFLISLIRKTSFKTKNIRKSISGTLAQVVEKAK